MIATSPDGQWAAVKRGREVVLLAGGAGPDVARPDAVRIELPTDDADLIMVGPPSVLAVVMRGAPGSDASPRLVLYQPPYLDPVARHDLDAPMRIAGLTGSRVVLVSLDGKTATIVRIAGRAFATQPLDPGSPIEFAVGLDRNQVLLGLLRKLETWDAVSGRPLLRMNLPLPPPPRTLGPAHGFVWATRPGTDDIFVYRMSDGRPFRHQLGVAIDDVIYHAASPLLILVTARGLVRLHCFAHSLTVIDAPWQPNTDLGQLVIGDDISLLGMSPHDDEPWRIPIGGAGAPAIAVDTTDAAGEPVASAADKLRAMRERTASDPIHLGDRPQVRPPPSSPGDGPQVRPPPSVSEGAMRDRTAHEPMFGGPPHGRPPSSVGDGPLVRARAMPGEAMETAVEPRVSTADELRATPERAAQSPMFGDRLPVRPPPSVGDGAPLRAPAAPRDPPEAAGEPAISAADKLRAMRERTAQEPMFGDRLPVRPPPSPGDSAAVRPRSIALGAPDARPAEPARDPAWRDPLAGYGAELARGGEGEMPTVATDTELGQLAQRLGLPPVARRALVALYGAYLVGEPAVTLARLARATGDWTEALGQGELGSLGMVRRCGGKVGLRGAVTDLLDGATPRTIRVVGDGPTAPRSGAVRMLRDGRSDPAIEAELVAQLGRIAVIEGRAARGLLEACLHGAIAVALAPPPSRPQPWPRDAAMIVIAEAAAPGWVARLPVITAA
jgi:hypothetical protein